MDSFPDIPAAEVVDDVAFRVLDVLPFENLDTRLGVETRDVEDLPECDGGNMTANMGGGEHADDGYPVGKGAEVDEIRVCHDIVG